MVVLESAGGIMNTGGSPYLQPDYLSPLPTTLDAKKSPLALLAQTCSQIGADSPGSKTLLPSLEKSKKSSSPRPKPQQQQQQQQSQTQPPQPQQTPPQQTTDTSRLAFKPYEANVLTRKSETPRPSSKSAQESEEKCRTPSRKSSTPSGDKSPAPAKSTSPVDSGASPIIRSGLEILQGHPKDLPLGTYKHPGLGLTGLPSACCPPSLDATNPAFRPPFAGGPYSPHHAAMLSGYPSPGPYVSYARVKTSSGGEALVPVCKDPYCTGCQLNMHGALVGGGACPSGCTQCDHQKYGLAAALSGLVPPPLSYQHLGRPYICNWIAGDNYCGKRFGTSDELLQHLRTHTTSSDLLNPLRYPNPPLSPLSAAARYHPYSKPGLPALASPYSAFNPTLGPYAYSPYALYGQRLGAAAVHP
ncbi:zinc finger protein Noc [Nilaparvata lugens]|uniref:zinc finger protein Noc n=1 Tax=Nilaparvata lugens TaxID=108931 RepID=UPI000B999022|nr:zinc finger protein Noc [Nilaparvata lugens]